MFIGDSSPGTSRGECLSPLSVAVSPGALMQFTPAGDNQKCHQRTSREKTEKEVWWQSKIRHQAQWKRQKKKSILWEIWGGGESLGLLKIPILNVSTRFLNQNHKIFEINKQQFFLRETQSSITKCPSLLSNSDSARQKQQPTTETPSPQASQRARLGKAGWFIASEVGARAWQAFRRKRKHGSHPWPFHHALGWWPASSGNKLQEIFTSQSSPTSSLTVSFDS